MKAGLTRQDLLDEIDFELTQGAIVHGDLGQSIESVRRYQNQLRTDIFGVDHPKIDQREAMGRLFQVNDMLLTLLQEMAKRIETDKVDLGGTTLGSSPAPTPLGSADSIDTAMAADAESAIVEAMRMETLVVNRGVIPSHLPVIGNMINKLKSALHNVTLYYLDQLAAKQYGINKVYGASLIHLQRMHDKDQLELARLRAQLTNPKQP